MADAVPARGVHTDISDSGHGPSRGYSGMNAHLKKYLDRHPKHSSEQASRRKSFGRPVRPKKKKG
jgi:hypothetical protein